MEEALGRVKDKTLAHLETARPFISLNAGLTALAGAALQFHGLPSFGTSFVIFAVPTIGYLGALYGTDFKDRFADRKTRPQRPIPSGRISEDEAVVLMMLCVGVGFLGSSWLGFPAVVTTCAVMVVGVVRALTKDMGIVAPLTRNLGTALNFMFGAVAVGLPVSPAVWIISLLFFIDSFPKTLVGGLWDIEADKATSVRTTWVRYGVRRTRWLVFAGTSVLLVMAGVVPIFTMDDAAGYYLLYVIVVLMVILAVRQLFHTTNGSTSSALAALNWLLRERSVLAGAVLAGTAGVVPAILITLPVAGLAEWSRIALMVPRMYRLQMSPDDTTPT